MNNRGIYFRFPQAEAMGICLDTLRELGYRAAPVIEVVPQNDDLTSALEIVRAHGGELFEYGEPTEGVGSAVRQENEEEIYTSAYGLDGVTVPAHVVTEDLPESYMNPSLSGGFASLEGVDGFPSDSV